MAASKTLNAEQRSLRATIASNTSWANTTDRTGRTAAARRAFIEQFERKVDPDGVMTPKDRAKAAEHARRVHYARLAYLSSRARQRRREGAD